MVTFLTLEETGIYSADANPRANIETAHLCISGFCASGTSSVKFLFILLGHFNGISSLLAHSLGIFDIISLSFSHCTL